MNELQVLSECKRQLAMIRSLEGLLEIRDKAKAIADFQKAKQDGFETANQGKYIVALAEAEIGKRIREQQASGELDAGKGGNRRSRSQDTTVKLADIGINKDQSSRCQKAADVLEADPGWFDKHLAECNATGQDFTQHAVIREAHKVRNQQTAKQEPPKVEGLYDVIVIDPPWPMQKIEREDRPNQAGFDYPTMTEAELAELELPAADDCHLWLWTTHKFLPMALRLAPVWGFKYVCTFVWHKNNGVQPFNLPKYNCEFALYCRRGTPKFVDLKQFWLCFQADQQGHSVKPDCFYDLVRRVTDGRRIDIFNRRKIDGFDVWGNES